MIKKIELWIIQLKYIEYVFPALLNIYIKKI